MTTPASPSAAGFSVLAGNRLDRLVGHLAEQMEARPLPPLEREMVVVQSQGMKRWLTLELARRRGLAASLTTPFPRPFIRHLLAQRRAAVPRPASEDIAGSDDSLFSRGLLLWRLIEILGSGSGPQRTLAAPRAYLADDADQRKLYQLSSRLATLYDEYQLYRGSMLRDWELGGVELEGPAAWQAALWRELASTGDADDRPLHAGLAALAHDLRNMPERAEWLPRRLSVLGVSSLPPVFVDLLVELARWMPVTVYLVSPTYHYWADLRSERETARLERRFAADGLATPFEDQHFESGHPLLASLGKQGRELFDVLQRADTEGSGWRELAFVEPGGDGVLASIQRDILHLETATATAPGAGAAGDTERDRRIDSGDRSLTVHICHSPMREMQVLWSELLRAFDELDGLQPSDVLVLLPDIEKYVPYIRAVFGVERHGIPRLPFSIADRGAGREQPPSEVILQLLDLASARVTLGDVFDVLETPAVLRAAGLVAEDLAPLRDLFATAGVRWGFSGEHRSDLFEVPPDDANSWRMGVERVLMGYATGPLDDGVGDALVEGVVPAAGDTAGDAQRLGAFVDFLSTLETALRGLAGRRTLEAWGDVVGELVDSFLLADGEDEERGLQLVRDAAATMGETADRIDARVELSLSVVREYLEEQLRLDGFGSGFLNGQMTFCALRPMRTIPFRVVAIAGLDAGVFPRRDRRPGFDLMAREPAPGDRSVRDDDRYLFLETLLATQERLILSHIGRSQQDGTERQASAVLGELLDYIDRNFRPSDGDGPARERLVTAHPLQPWSVGYFRDPSLRTYGREAAALAQSLAGERALEPRLLDGELVPEKAEIGETIDLQELIRFWRSPSQDFIEKGLGLALTSEAPGDRDAEPFALRGLEGWPVREWLLDRRLHGRSTGQAADPEDEARYLRARGDLPPGSLGDATLGMVTREIENFLSQIPEHRRRPRLSFELPIAGRRLVCHLDRMTDLGLLRFRCGQLRPQDWMVLWIERLAWALQSGEKTPAQLIGRDGGWTVASPANPSEHLTRLVELFAAGRRRPLPYFGAASMAFAEHQWALLDPRRRGGRPPIDVARAVFEGKEGPPQTERPSPESDDPYVRLAFRGGDPLADSEFADLAERIWRPILENRREL